MVVNGIPEECMEKVKELLDYLVIDYTLGIPNRNYYHLFINKELALSRRYGLPLSVLFVDVDGLKRVNDTFGHHAGDEYLKAIADMLRKVLRESDLLIRWGGDEFVVLLHTDKKGAKRARERIYRMMKDAFLCKDGLCIPLSASIGVAEVEGKVEEAVALADKDMYEEKRKKKDADRVDGGAWDGRSGKAPVRRGRVHEEDRVSRLRKTPEAP